MLYPRVFKFGATDVRLRQSKDPAEMGDPRAAAVRPRRRHKGSLSGRERKGGPAPKGQNTGTRKTNGAANALGKDSLAGMESLMSGWMEGRHSGVDSGNRSHRTPGPGQDSTPTTAALAVPSVSCLGHGRLRGQPRTQVALSMTFGPREGV